MPTLSFYRQGRHDGGIRTGVETDSEILLSRFEEGSEEFDPTLAWFVDVIFRGEPLPERAEDARQWLLDHSDLVRTNLQVLADLAGQGIDPDVTPLRLQDRVAGSDVLLEVRCAVNRWEEGRRIPTVVRDIAERWEDLIQSLPNPEPIAR